MASTVADDGSIIIFILSQTRSMQSIIESSFAVKILSTFFLITEKVSSLSDVSNPSATVYGLSEGVSFPEVNDIYASFALSGSAPIT